MQAEDANSGAENAPGKYQGQPGAQASPKQQEPRKPHPNRVAFDELQGLYPALFNLRDARPLKIGIHKDLAEDGKLSKTRIRRALNFYVRQLAYLRSVATGGERHGLTGPDGTVTDEEQAYARTQVEEIEKKRRARRAEQKKAQRHRKQNKSAEEKTPEPAKPEVEDRPARKDPEKKNRQPAKKKEDPATRMEEKLASLKERFNQ